MRLKSEYTPNPGSKYPVAYVEGAILEASDVVLHLDTTPPQRIEAHVTRANRGIAGRIMAKIALTGHDPIVMAKISTNDTPPYSGSLTIEGPFHR